MKNETFRPQDRPDVARFVHLTLRGHPVRWRIDAALAAAGRPEPDPLATRHRSLSLGAAAAAPSPRRP